MFRKAAFCFAAVALMLSAAEAEPPSVIALEQAMSCKHMLHPRLLLLALQRDGVIGHKARAYEDGAPYFAVAKPFRINSFEVKYVEGWDWDYRGHLFKRGPGTAPGRHMSVVLKGEERAVEKRFDIDSFRRTSTANEDWGMYAYGGGPYFDHDPGLTELTCQTPLEN